MRASSPASRAASRPVPLVVDIDGTLLRTDLLHESALQFLARHPFQAWRLLLWLIAGKARLKAELAARIDVAADTLPMREGVLTAIRNAQDEGRPVYLASASDARYVTALASHLGGLRGAFGSENGVNLSGRVKAELLHTHLGGERYDYIGNSAADVPVWTQARTALVVSTSKRFSERVAKRIQGAQVIAHEPVRARVYLRALRAHQWAKNLLIFLPIIAGHALSVSNIARSALAFACFCLAASSAYIINDLLDLPSDRQHPRKRHRPFASGDIPILHGPVMAAALLAAAVAGAVLLPAWFTAALALYVLLTLSYSLVLKRRVLIDVFSLAALYTLRVLAGVAAVGVASSPWLLMFSLFLFMGLAVVKRCSELIARRNIGEETAPGRGYHVEDLSVLFGLAATSGFCAALVVALYIAGPEVQILYRHPERLWLICPLLLYWISRVILLANRGELHDDPVIFALTDRVSWTIATLAACVIAAAL